MFQFTLLCFFYHTMNDEATQILLLYNTERSRYASVHEPDDHNIDIWLMMHVFMMKDVFKNFCVVVWFEGKREIKLINLFDDELQNE